tara:strand:+ start:12003 stop:12350 length:348 start_codon:yes stop_codon:yes gene_type:complete
MVVKLIEEVEKKFHTFFLNDISFDIDGKIIKKGKLINVSIKDFFLEFKLEVQKGGIKVFEVPYPFELLDNRNSVVFNYRLDKFVFNDIVRLAKVKRIKPKKNSKFYDVVMVMKKL